MPQTEHICTCGKSFTIFRSYRDHIVKHKCIQNVPQTPPMTPKTQQNHQDLDDSGTKNTNTNLSNNSNNSMQTTENSNTLIPAELVAYKSSHSNINPKVICNYCDKYYSNHHINTHRQRCKSKYKECYEYKLLVRAGIRNIPKTYIEVRDLYCKLLDEQPEIFTNMPKISSS